MSLIARVGAILVLFAAMPFAAAHSVQNGSKGCTKTEFWYSDKNTCLPYGGPPTPPAPPKGNDCPPSGYYWGGNQGCCVPRNPPPSQQPPPQCRKDWDWYPALHKCLPHPSPPSPPPSQPSQGHGGGKGYGNNNGHGNNGYGNNYGGGYGGKRSHKSRAAPLCPSGLDACPILGMHSSDYECLDTATELESCGGCVSLGKGQDCSAIPGAWNVGCDQGSCAVYTCVAGFKRSHDGRSCIQL